MSGGQTRFQRSLVLREWRMMGGFLLEDVDGCIWTTADEYLVRSLGRCVVQLRSQGWDERREATEDACEASIRSCCECEAAETVDEWAARRRTRRQSSAVRP